MTTGECNLTPTQLLGCKPQHGCPGIEALLHRQAKEKKQGANTRQQGVSNLRCTYSPGGNRCTEKVLPLTKHCMKRILYIAISYETSFGDKFSLLAIYLAVSR